MNKLVQLTGKLHSNLVHTRRIRQLQSHLSTLIPPDTTTLLDVGCGDGLLTALLQSAHPGLNAQGVDVLVRPDTHVPVKEFDGMQLPFPDHSFDAVTFIDVLHHTTHPELLLAEAARVARHCVIVKDHVRSGKISESILRFMDWVGNRSHGVALPFNYLSRPEFAEMVKKSGLYCESQITRLNLYPFPATLLFDGQLHFMARYGKEATITQNP